MRKSLSTFVLLLALCCPALAGDMLTPPTVPQPPATNSVASAPDDETSEATAEEDSAAQAITATQIAVSIFESLLAII